MGGFVEASHSYLTDNYGTHYNNAFYKGYWGDVTETEYLLNMKYSRFKGVLYVSKGTDRNGELGYLSIIYFKGVHTNEKMY